ncbi:MAG: hypothetical protein Q8P80_02845 [Candidatus Levybacteria bacterium]|nr:hypothetical protein [Candidatus Levybacteria bacterium]
MKIFSQYYVIARIFPATLSSVPFFILHYFFLRDRIGDFLIELSSIKWLSDVTISVALIFLLVQISRLISKEFYEKIIYSDGLGLPTTNYLLHLDSFYSAEFTKKIHQKIFNDFNINIPSAKKEISDEIGSRKKIAEAVNLIRTKVGAGNLVQQHNIEYGFIRNIIGGSVIATIVSILNAVIFYWIYFDKIAFILSGIIAIVYLLLVGFGKKLIHSFGTAYARVLIQEYMSKKLGK